MRFLSLLKRELGSLYLSPIAAAVGTLFLFFNGVLLTLILLSFSSGMGAVPSRAVYASWLGSAFTWLMCAVVVPAVTMRLLSEERRQGSLELLQTAPVSDAAIVLSKWLGAWLFFCSLWLPGVVAFGFLRAYAPLDWRAFACAMLMVALFGALWCAVGLLCSALTSHLMIAFVATGGAMLAALLLSFLGNLDPGTFALGGLKGFGEALIQLFKLLNPLDALDTFARGTIDTRVVVFHLSGTALLLLVTHQLLAARRFRG